MLLGFDVSRYPGCGQDFPFPIREIQKLEQSVETDIDGEVLAKTESPEDPFYVGLRSLVVQTMT